tara:strand:+ start:770 stop:1096 length:327 start_codon:yes stop_codon:yes gene_type:complete
MPPTTPPMMPAESSSAVESGGGAAGIGEAAVPALMANLSTVMPRAVEAALAELSVELSADVTSAVVVVLGTAIRAVIMTDAAVMEIVTSDALTPAALAMLAVSAVVSA